ncbi:D-alanyl-D-alanine carboxypeptidase family protein [Sphingomonas sp. ID0503]|uniref:D-alanyl-D-alanine carboxypeptidase family protein n=1 Tax=Sphingomonas sp. ID0503 TaxID=3399691 RepID=UPI003AFAB432
MRGFGVKVGLWMALLGGVVPLTLAAPAAAAEMKVPGKFLRPHYAAILVDPSSKEVLYSNAADQLRHPASITKIMTLYMAFDAIEAGKLSLNDRVPISRFAASQRPSRLGLAPGKSLSVDQAIRVIAVQSANDIAVAMAEKLGGTERSFATMMNAKARSLGMTNTNFVNATGLPNPDHVTTARDLATMSAALLKNHAQRYAYFSQQKYQYEKQLIANHNKMLGRFPGMDGIKTGFTNDAGFTLAASAMRGGKRLIAVVLGEPSSANRDRDVGALLDAGFNVLKSRSMGAPETVASLLGPISHPAVRMTEGVIEQGSADSRRPFAPAPEPKPVAAKIEKAEAKKVEPVKKKPVAVASKSTKAPAKGKAGETKLASVKSAIEDSKAAEKTGTKATTKKAGSAKAAETKVAEKDASSKSGGKSSTTKEAAAKSPAKKASAKTAENDKAADKKKAAGKG